MPTTTHKDLGHYDAAYRAGEFRELRARRFSGCPICAEAIRVGMPILVAPGFKAVHKRCLELHDA